MDIPFFRARDANGDDWPDMMSVLIVALHAAALVLFLYKPVVAAILLALAVAFAFGTSRPLPVMLFAVSFIWVNEIIGDFLPTSQFTAWKDVILFLIIIGWVARSMVLRRGILLNSPLSVPMAMVFLLYLASTVLTPSLMQAALGVKASIFYMTWYFVLPDIIHTKHDARKLVLALIFTTVCLSLYNFWRSQLPFGAFPPTREGKMLTGMLIMHYSASPFIIPLGVIFAVAMLPRLTGWQRVYAFLGAALGVPGVIITLTRGQTGVMMMVLLLMGFFAKRRVSFWILLVGLAAGPFIQSTAKINVAERASSAFDSGDTSLNARETEFSSVTLPFVLAHPFGAGTGTMSAKGAIKVWGGGSSTELLLQRGIIHNGLLLVAIETGWLGLAAYLWLLATAVITAYRYWRKARDPFVKDLALGCLGVILFFVPMHILAAMITTALISFVIWIVFGLIALLPLLDERALEETARKNALPTG